MTATLPARFDVLDPGLAEDPYPTYARLREAGAVCRAGPATWAVVRYQEAAALLRDPRLRHESVESIERPHLVAEGLPHDELARRMHAAREPNAELPRIVSRLDPPDHTRVRGLIQLALNPRMVRRLRGSIRRRADELIADLIERGGGDAVEDLALPLQMRVMCGLLGVPEADQREVARHAVALGRAIILIPFVDGERGGGATDAKWLRTYVAGLLAERRRTPRDDVISAMLAARRGSERLSDDEIVDNAVFLFFAGLETSIHLMAGGCAALLRSPDQLARLRADASLMQSAVEEILRYEAPLQWISRVTAAPVEVGGRTIRPGRVLLLVLASANRDVRQFADPDVLDVGRRPNPHLSFGGGGHHCLGVLLARAQGVVVLERLLSRCSELQPAGPFVVRPHPNVRGYASVPLAMG
jgi:cytochrome P450